VATKKAPARRLRSLKVTAAFRTFVLDQLDGLDDVVPRAMFGGVGLYCRGVFFGILASDVLYLKVDDTNRRDYEHAGMTAGLRHRIAIHAFDPSAREADGDRPSAEARSCGAGASRWKRDSRW